MKRFFPPTVVLPLLLPLADDEPLVSLIAVGDVLLGRGVADQPDPLGAAALWLWAADLVFIWWVGKNQEIRVELILGVQP